MKFDATTVSFPDASSKAARIAEACGDLPPMPHIAAQLIEKLSDDNTTPGKIHQLLIKDQALAAHVLKVANSPYYGAARSISTLRDAVMFMGFDSIRSLVMTAVLKGMFSNSGFAEKLLWEHAVGCAFVARQLGEEVGIENREETYLAGLMHDFGKAVLFLRAPAVMGEILQEVYNEGLNFFEMEKKKLGFTHADVGRIIADKWRFSSSIEDSIANHHEPDLAICAPELTHVVSLANSICHKLEIGPTRNPDLDLGSIQSAKALGLDQSAIEKAIIVVKENLDGLKN
jgi:putative nucleotidyltransferase with HDIG domain